MGVVTFIMLKWLTILQSVYIKFHEDPKDFTISLAAISTQANLWTPTAHNLLQLGSQQPMKDTAYRQAAAMKFLASSNPFFVFHLKDRLEKMRETKTDKVRLL